MSLLKVRNLSIEFHTTNQIVRAVRGVDFDIAAGERVGLVGESGSGKTTIALALMRMLKPPGRIAGGSGNLDGIELFELDARAVRQARLKLISYIPQGAMNALNPVLRVREQMLDGLKDHDEFPGETEAEHKVSQALTGVGLSPQIADLFPHQLSGGMKQRVCIAIALMLGPKMIIADEPTSALDVISQRQVMETLDKAQAAIGCGMILIGHDMGLMAQVTDRIIVMREGRILEDAPTRNLFARPANAYSRELIDSVPTLGGRMEIQALSEGSAENFLTLDAVGKTFGQGIFGGRPKMALAPISLTLDAARPRIIAVVGQSGSGKTTLARMILGLETPTTGVIRYENTALSSLDRAGRLAFRRDVQAIFQDPYASFNPFYRVRHALSLPLQMFGLASSAEDIRAACERACTSVGLNAGDVLDRFPHELSGGQRQRLMVARALLVKPRLIVADEPVSMVDASLRMTILSSLSALRKNHGISILYITHDLATAYHVSDEVIVLHAGRIVEAGRPADVIAHPAHPYTQALVAAIPWPDPNRPWPPIDKDVGVGWDAPPVLAPSMAHLSSGARS